jgi:hypothetical protein
MRAFRRLVPVLAVLLVVSACDDSGTSPSDASTVVISTPSPAAANAVVTAVGTPPGVFIARGSGQVSIPITVTTTRDVPWAQLYVYLLTADGYCGQNLPDAPTWGPFPKGQAQQVTISGFQVFRTPCEVTGLRAMLHLRNNGLLTPPTASETIAEATRQVAWTIVR